VNYVVGKLISNQSLYRTAEAAPAFLCRVHKLEKVANVERKKNHEDPEMVRFAKMGFATVSECITGSPVPPPTPIACVSMKIY
jgi:hypothetical protein